MKAGLNTADALNDETRLIIKSCRRDIAPSTAQAIGIKFAAHLDRMSLEFGKIAVRFRTAPLSNGADVECGSNKSHIDAEDSKKSNEKSKEQLLAEFSSSSSSATNSSDDDGNDVPRIKRKKKSRGNKTDPNLSQINGIDDEENILVKNEPLLDSQLLNSNAESTSKNVNVIEELNKWKDYGNEGEFYGFDATDTDDCANSSIEIGVKNEPTNGSIVTSDSEKKIEDNEATQMYSVDEEIARANASATSKSNDPENSSTTFDEASIDESTKEIVPLREVAPVATSANNDATDEVSHEPLQNENGNDSSSENDASDEGGDDEDEDDADEDNDREIAR